MVGALYKSLLFWKQVKTYTVRVFKIKGILNKNMKKMREASKLDLEDATVPKRSVCLTYFLTDGCIFGELWARGAARRPQWRHVYPLAAAAAAAGVFAIRRWSCFEMVRV